MSTLFRRFAVTAIGLVLWNFVANPAAAQQFLQKTFQDEQGTHKYAVFVPAGYQPGRPIPAVLYLHGAGERGTDGVRPTQVGLGPYLKAYGSRIPFLAVFPQVEDTHGRLLTAWQAGQPAADRALKILDAVMKEYSVDKQRVTLAGWSMGGFGAWSLAATHPDRWAGVAILSGGGDAALAPKLKSIPIWILHGYHDHLVSVENGQQIVQALKDAGGDVAYEEFPDASHDISAEAFGNDAVLKWLADPRRQPRRRSETPPIKITPPPFVPAVRIPQAVGIRLGNTALDALSYAAPSYVPANLLTGRIADMFDSTTAQNRTFSVRFSGISYSAQLGRVELKATGKDRVHLALGMQNVYITVAGTSVTGARHAAQAGPVTVAIGQNRPVYLSMDATPYVDSGKLRLRLISANFSIPPDNYAVSAPAGVSTRGIGMTEEKVSSGIVSGLYGARPRIENEVRNLAPTILRQLEDHLVASDIGPIVAGMWPFPVYQPRLRTYFEQVATDENGVSVVMGVEAAAVNPRTPPKPVITATGAGVTLDHLTAGGAQLGVALAPQLLGPITQSVIDEGLAELDVLDLPEKSFARFADRAFLETIVPDMKRLESGTEVRSRFALAAPLVVDAVAQDQASTDPLTVALQFQLPKVALDIGTRAPQAKAFTPYARFDIAIRERVTVKLDRETHEKRALEMQWQEGHDITAAGAFAKEVSPDPAAINVDEFTAAFKENWQKWTGSGPAAVAAIPDVEFSTTKLRLNQLSGPAPVLTGVFEIPGTRITNGSNATLSYEIRGPYTTWGTYTLEPGKIHEFKFPHPLTYRQGSGTTREMFTLVAGSDSEFRVPNRGGPPRLVQSSRTADGD
ncbi:MAG TPA: alpha/beta hydrolase-fold protein [Planctomycetaceae bacterium]|nr:alpha/beta hydrolase-fold protein [Planctomycetaceae bacterium]